MFPNQISFTLLGRRGTPRGWLQWLVFFLVAKFVALGASSVADFMALRKCYLVLFVGSCMVVRSQISRTFVFSGWVE